MVTVCCLIRKGYLSVADTPCVETSETLQQNERKLEQSNFPVCSDEQTFERSYIYEGLGNLQLF